MEAEPAMIQSHEALCFDVERALAKALGVKCETFLCTVSEFKIRIGQRWNLVLNPEQLESLWDDKDVPSALRDTFDALKPDCLTFQSYSR
jgi:hypothetical protein